MQPTILIVDDEKHTREGLRSSLEDSFDVYTAPDISSALNVLEADPVEVMVTDLRIGGEDGMKLIDRALTLPHPPVCIVMTAFGSVATAVDAMKHGAYDFVTKPLDLDDLEIRVNRALRSRAVEQENKELRQQVDQRFGLESLIGNSAAMTEVFDVIRQVAPSRATVLVLGESGTGKELVAHAIHNLSGRPKQKFVAVHCAALSPQLLESELFGHERGAFTGAVERRIGRFEQASGGTLFLDEIGEIDSNLQVKVLRVLGEDRSFERVGGNSSIKVDVRLVSATNKSLEKMVAEGKFRDDLFYRLNVVQITIPPLRERKEDIPLLLTAFLKQFAKENGKPLRELTADASDALLSYSWPGNVRELRTAVEHGVVMATGAKIGLRDLPLALRQTSPEAKWNSLAGAKAGTLQGVAGGNVSHLNLQETEHRLIMRALDESKGSRTEAAQRLGISRRTLHRRLKQIEETES